MSEEGILEGCGILEGGNAVERARENRSWVLKGLQRGNDSCKGMQVVLTSSLIISAIKKESQAQSNDRASLELSALKIQTNYVIQHSPKTAPFSLTMLKA